MMRVPSVLLLLLMILVIGACGVVPRSAAPPPQVVNNDTVSSTSEPEQATTDKTSSADSSDDEKEKVEKDTHSMPPPAAVVSSRRKAKSLLMQAYREWKGTPYQLGGASSSGVDCSRFMNIVFDEYLGIELPTNTRSQLYEGDKVRRAGIRAGDLIFFRTGRKTLHVGVAVNRGEFLHASTSNGVMISKLGNSYWRTRFLAARRVL